MNLLRVNFIFTCSLFTSTHYSNLKTFSISTILKWILFPHSLFTLWRLCFHFPSTQVSSSQVNSISNWFNFVQWLMIEMAKKGLRNVQSSGGMKLCGGDGHLIWSSGGELTFIFSTPVQLYSHCNVAVELSSPNLNFMWVNKYAIFISLSPILLFVQIREKCAFINLISSSNCVLHFALKITTWKVEIII